MNHSSCLIETAGQVHTPESPDRSEETTTAGIPWLQFHRHRVEIRKRWPTLWDLETVRDFFANAVSRQIVAECVLDVGATDRVWESTVNRHWSGAEYRSLDIDRTNRHDYYDFREIDREFDLVMCLEVLEHVPPKTGLEIVQNCADACRAGGYVICSVPNVTMPRCQSEFTHVTAINHHDLGAILEWSGLEVLALSRVFLGSTRRYLTHRYPLALLHRALGIDFCPSVVALARKPEEQST